jgi:hypothetical protein
MQALLIASYFGSESFERDVAIKLRVAGEINFAHAALTEFGTDFVTTESSSGIKHCTQRGSSPTVR